MAPPLPCLSAVAVSSPAYMVRNHPLNRLDAGDLLYNVDFRSVYSTILSKWMQAPAAHVLGRDFPNLNFV
jgi:uncharacterized protein (DUF1501 family)